MFLLQTIAMNIKKHLSQYVNKECNINLMLVFIFGDGTWLGANVVVVGNVSISKQCVIGANSVVTKDIPDYCVATGLPAKVIKQNDFNQKIWIKANS